MIRLLLAARWGLSKPRRLQWTDWWDFLKFLQNLNFLIFFELFSRKIILSNDIWRRKKVKVHNFLSFLEFFFLPEVLSRWKWLIQTICTASLGSSFSSWLKGALSVGDKEKLPKRKLHKMYNFQHFLVI